MSPEILQSKEFDGFKADIYAFGMFFNVNLFEIFTTIWKYFFNVNLSYSFTEFFFVVNLYFFSHLFLGLILWEILTSEELFSEFSQWNEFKTAICDKGVRPPIPDKLPSGLKHLLQRCWSDDPKIVQPNKKLWDSNFFF